jgi:hypothetical protein
MAMAYKVIYEDIYRLHSKYERVPPEVRNDDYWVSLNDEISAYLKIHGDSFTTALIVAVLRPCLKNPSH